MADFQGVVLGIVGAVAGGTIITVFSLSAQGIKGRFTAIEEENKELKKTVRELSESLVHEKTCVERRNTHESRIKDLEESESYCVTDDVCKERQKVLDDRITALCTKTTRELDRAASDIKTLEGKINRIEVGGI